MFCQLQGTRPETENPAPTRISDEQGDHHVKKPLITLVAVGLIAATLAGPAEAKKKKPKPPTAVQMDQTYFLVNTNESGCASEGMLLMLNPIETGGSCGSYFGGPVNTALSQSGGRACTPEIPTQGSLCGMISYSAGEGLPVVLDATKKITGTIFVSSYRGAAQNPGGLSGGPTTFNMQLTGTVNGEEKTVGTFSSDYTVTPDKQIYEVPFEIALDPALDKAQVTTLLVDFWNTGPAALHGFYNVNTSKIVLPVWGTPAAS